MIDRPRFTTPEFSPPRTDIAGSIRRVYAEPAEHQRKLRDVSVSQETTIYRH